MRLYMSESLEVSRNLAKSGCRKHFSYGNRMILICHLIWQNHVLKRPYVSIGRSASL